MHQSHLVSAKRVSRNNADLLSIFIRDDDEDENASATATTKKRKSEVVEAAANTKTLFSYFGQKNATKTDPVQRRTSGSAFFRAAHLKPARFPM